MIRDKKDAKINENRLFKDIPYPKILKHFMMYWQTNKVKLMGTGIIICGLNGSGKSTLGKALAEKLHYHFIDDEDLYFSKTDSGYSYASSRTRKEAEICTRRKKGSLTLSNPVLRILSKNGYNH